MTTTESDQQPLHSKDKDSSTRNPDRPPKRKTCTGYCCYKCLVVLYSLLFLVIGICLLGIGIWLVKVKGNIDSINDALTAPVILAVVVGIFMIIFAFIGVIGALTEKIVLLWIFFAIAIVVFVGQVIIGILAFVYREEAMDVVNTQLKFAIEKYHTDNDVRRGVNHIQQKHRCCGLEGPKTWESNEDHSCGSGDCGVPDSCCKDVVEGCGSGIRNGTRAAELKSLIYRDGCTTRFRIWVEGNLDLVGATALGLALLHVLGIFLVYFFITSVQDRVWLFKYRKRYYAN